MIVLKLVVNIVEAIFGSAIHKRHKSNRKMDEDNFVLRVPKVFQWFAVLITFCLLVVAIFVFFASRGDYNSTAGLVVSLVVVAAAIYFLYLSAYHILYETRITGNEIRHKELFYPEYTFTFDEIKKAQFKRSGAGTFLTVFSETETLFVVEPSYIGYSLLLSRLDREGVRIESK